MKFKNYLNIVLTCTFLTMFFLSNSLFEKAYAQTTSYFFNDIYDITKLKNTTVLTNNNKIYYLDKGSLKEFKISEPNIRKTALLNNDNINVSVYIRQNSSDYGTILNINTDNQSIDKNSLENTLIEYLKSSPSLNINDIAMNRNNAKWFKVSSQNTDGKEISKLLYLSNDDNTKEVIIPNIDYNNISIMKCDEQNNLYFTYNDLENGYSSKTSYIYKVTENNQIKISQKFESGIKKFLFDNDNNLWVVLDTTNSSNLIKLDSDLNLVTKYYINYEINDIACDSDGNPWIATLKGIKQFSDNKFVDRCADILKDSTNVKRISVYDENNLSFITADDYESSFKLTEVSPDDSSTTKIDVSKYKRFPYTKIDNLKKSWTVKFKMPIDANSVNSSNVKLVDDYGNPIESTFKVFQDTITIYPIVEYSYGQTYHVLVEPGIRSSSGKLLKVPCEKEFLMLN